MNRANEARDMTKKLGLLAEKYQCAIALIGHMNKAAGNKAAYEECEQQMEVLIEQMMERWGVNEQLKAENQME